jgi:hypothetical protein
MEIHTIEYWDGHNIYGGCVNNDHPNQKPSKYNEALKHYADLDRYAKGHLTNFINNKEKDQPQIVEDGPFKSSDYPLGTVIRMSRETLYIEEYRNKGFYAVTCKLDSWPKEDTILMRYPIDTVTPTSIKWIGGIYAGTINLGRVLHQPFSPLVSRYTRLEIVRPGDNSTVSIPKSRFQRFREMF